MKQLSLYLTLILCALPFSMAHAGPDVDKWVAELKSKDVAARRKAVAELGKLGPAAASASAAIMKCIKEDPWGVSRQALKSFKQIGPGAAPALLDQLDFESSFPLTGFERRRETVFSENGEAMFWAARSIEEMGGSAIQSVKDALQNATGHRRVNLASILYWLKKDLANALPAFTKSLTHKEVSVRRSAALALGKMGAPAQSALPELARLLDDKDQSTRLTCIDALSKVGVKVAASLTPSLLKAAQDKSAVVREASLKALSRLKVKGTDAFAAVTKGVSDKNPDVRLAAAEYIIDHKAPASAVQALIKMTRDEDEDQRNEAMEALGSLGPKAGAAVTRLAELLNDKERPLQVTAAEALGNIGEPALQVLDALNKAVAAKNGDLSLEAIYTIRKLGPKASRSTPVLIAALKRDRLIRWSATGTLGFFGKKAKAAAPDLVRVMGDRDAGIRASAAKSLGQIGANDDKSLLALAKRFKNTEERINVRQEAFTSLNALLSDEKRVTFLVSCLDDAESRFPIRAAEQLGKMGVKAKAAADALSRAVGSTNDDIAEAAEKALLKVLPPEDKDQ
jgi:HEAT repeat protein